MQLSLLPPGTSGFTSRFLFRLALHFPQGAIPPQERPLPNSDAQGASSLLWGEPRKVQLPAKPPADKVSPLSPVTYKETSKGVAAARKDKPQQMLAHSTSRRHSGEKPSVGCPFKPPLGSVWLSEQISLGASPASPTDWLERRQSGEPGTVNIKHGVAF